MLDEMLSVLKVIDDNLVKSVHDCSKGGIAVAVSEMCMTNNIGCKIRVDDVPGEKLSVDRILFSESHSRYLLALERKSLKRLESVLKKNKVSFREIGEFGGSMIQFANSTKSVIDLSVNRAQKTWLELLKNLVLHG